MAQRINITIPDSLYDRLQTIKDRLNVSGICQEAIMNAVAYEEIKNKDVPALEKLTEKLRKQKEEFVMKDREAGKVDGITDALELDYHEFVVVEKASGNLSTTDGWAFDPEELLGGNLMGWLEVRRLDETEKEDKSFDRRAYIEGWIDGVMEVWEEVKDKL